MKNPIVDIYALTFVLVCALFRPTLWGQSFTLIGMMLLTPMAIFFVVKMRSDDFRFERWMIILTCITISYWTYCVAAAVLIGDSNIEFVMKAAAAGIFSSLIYCLILSDAKLNKSIFSYFAVLNSILAWSIIVTTILLTVVGYDALTYFHLEIKGYQEGEMNGDVLFPFSPIYGLLMEYGIYRFLAIYRESGIAQLFLVWSAAYLFFARAKPIYILGAVVGAVLTASTSVVFSLGFALLGYYYWERKVSIKTIFIFGILIVAFVILLLYIPGLGLMDKQETHFDSIDDREYAMSFVYSNFSKLFFGTGLYNMNAPYINIGINAISAIYFVGIFGFLIYISQFIIYPCLSPGGGRYAILVLPLFVTSLLFQPLMDAPLAYMLLYCLPPRDF